MVLRSIATTSNIIQHTKASTFAMPQCYQSPHRYSQTAIRCRVTHLGSIENRSSTRSRCMHHQIVRNPTVAYIITTANVTEYLHITIRPSYCHISTAYHYLPNNSRSIHPIRHFLTIHTPTDTADILFGNIIIAIKTSQRHQKRRWRIRRRERYVGCRVRINCQ